VRSIFLPPIVEMRSYSPLTVTWPGGIGDPNGPDGQTIPVGGRRKSRRNRKGRKGSRKNRTCRKTRR
jgi:hypothetical protein